MADTILFTTETYNLCHKETPDQLCSKISVDVVILASYEGKSAQNIMKMLFLFDQKERDMVMPMEVLV